MKRTAPVAACIIVTCLWTLSGWDVPMPTDVATPAARHSLQHRHHHTRAPGDGRTAGPAAAASLWDPVTNAMRADPASKKAIPLRSERLRRFSPTTVNTVNDWHFAMMNDKARNDAFRIALKEAITPGVSTVMDVGSGAGLLSLLAAQAGAKEVFAIEASRDLAGVSREILASPANRHFTQGRVHLVNSLSTRLSPGSGVLPPARSVDIIVSEVLGTFLEGESALEYISDAREKFLAPTGTVIPAGGVQYASVVECAALRDVSSVASYSGVDLRAFSVLRDTDTVVFTKQLGFTLRSAGAVDVSEKFPLYSVDYQQGPSSLQGVQPERSFVFIAERDCVMDAVVFHWEAWVDRGKRVNISTHFAAEGASLAREVAWGQALQLLGEEGQGEGGSGSGSGGQASVRVGPFYAKKGERFELRVTGLRGVSTMRGYLARLGGSLGDV